MANKDENLVSLRSIRTFGGRRLVDLADSANLYLTPEQGKLYEGAVESVQYKNGVLQPLYAAEEALPQLVKSLKPQLESGLTLVDCGPGTLDDGRLHVRLLTQATRLEAYLIIDINRSLIEGVSQGLLRQGLSLQVRTISERFENLKRADLGLLDSSDALFIFGSTVMNFEASIFRKIVRQLTRPGDLVSSQAILRGGTDASMYLRQYKTPSIIDFTFGPIQLLGGRQEQFAADFEWVRDRVEFRFKARERVFLALNECPCLDPGDLVVTGFSRRPSGQEHHNEMKGLFATFSSRLSRDNVMTSVGMV